MSLTDIYATLNFAWEWKWYLAGGAVALALFPAVFPALVRFFTETTVGRYMAIGFLAVGGAFFAFLSAFNAGRASAYRDKVIEQQAKLKATPPPAKKKPPNWFGRN